MALGIYNRFTSNSVAASGFLKGCVSILTGRSLLTNAERSVKCWEEKNLQVKLDIKELNESLLGNLKRTRTAKASTLLKIFDAVQTNQDFEIAENALLEFRKGINTPKDSLPMVVIRSCLRLDRPDKALTIAINKRKYGVFPSANVYNVIMDGYLSKGHYKGVVRTYQQLLMDELQPNVNSYSLAVLGHILLDFDGGYDTAIKLAKECLERNPQNKRSRRPVLAIIDQSMKNGDREKVKELLDIISDHEPYKKVDINTRIRAFASIQDFTGSFQLLQSLLDHPYLSVSAGVIDALNQLIHDDNQMKEQFISLKEKLQSANKISPETEDKQFDTISL